MNAYLRLPLYVLAFLALVGPASAQFASTGLGGTYVILNVATIGSELVVGASFGLLILRLMGASGGNVTGWMWGVLAVLLVVTFALLFTWIGFAFEIWAAIFLPAACWLSAARRLTDRQWIRGSLWVGASLAVVGNYILVFTSSGRSPSTVEIVADLSTVGALAAATISAEVFAAFRSGPLVAAA